MIEHTINERTGHVTRITDGVWTVHTGFLFFGLPISNRMTLVHIPADGDRPASLMMINAVRPNKALIEEVDRLQKEVAPLRYIVTPGDWHHLYLKAWKRHEAFADATIYVPKGRIQSKQPRLECELLDLTWNPVKPHKTVFPELAPHLEVVPFYGLRQPFDMHPRNELYFYHRPSGTLITGDTMVSYQAVAPRLPLSLFFKAPKGSISWNPTGRRIIANWERARASANFFLTWEFDRLIPPHGEPGGICNTGAKTRVKQLFIKMVL